MTNKKNVPVDTVPVNTTEQVNRDPLGFLAEATIFGPSAAIERQEATGQQSFVNSETLPMLISTLDMAILALNGVEFGEPVEGDALFRHVELPAGWKKISTDHAMWSNLVDDKGRKRASIFYKAAFYDRSAHLQLCRRYSISFDYDRARTQTVAVAHVMDGEMAIHSTDPLQIADNEPRTFSDAAGLAAEVWLTEHYPNWKDAGAYWDIPGASQTSEAEQPGSANT